MDDSTSAGGFCFAAGTAAAADWTTLTAAAMPAELLSLWPVRPIRKPTPIARTSVATPAISAALAFHLLFEPPDWAGGGGGVAPPAPPGAEFIDSMKTTASMKGRRGSPRRWPQFRQ